MDLYVFTFTEINVLYILEIYPRIRPFAVCDEPAITSQATAKVIAVVWQIFYGEM